MDLYKNYLKGLDKMIKVSPSILSADFANLQRDIDMVEKFGADYLHIDVMDGMFVPNISIGVPVVKSIRKVTDMFLDTHLMIERPIRYIEAFANAGADLLTIHIEADMPDKISETLDKIHELGLKAGLSVRPKTPVEDVFKYLDRLDLVLIMTVEPGFGGQSFMADMLPKMSRLREEITNRKLNCEIEVDGGVNLETAVLCAEAGADVLVAGSALFGASDVEEFIQALKKL